MRSPQTQRVSALPWTTEVNSCFYSWFVFTIKKIKGKWTDWTNKANPLKTWQSFVFFLMKPRHCVNTSAPRCHWGQGRRETLDGYRNSGHTWVCSCISWQESEAALEMLLSWCDGMSRAPCLLLHTKAEKSTLPHMESISLQVPNTQSIRGQFLTCLTFLPCTEGFLAFVYYFLHQTANFIRSKSRSDYLGILPCSSCFLGR